MIQNPALWQQFGQYLEIIEIGFTYWLPACREPALTQKVSQRLHPPGTSFTITTRHFSLRYVPHVTSCARSCFAIVVDSLLLEGACTGTTTPGSRPATTTHDVCNYRRFERCSKGRCPFGFIVKRHNKLCHKHHVPPLSRHTVAEHRLVTKPIGKQERNNTPIKNTKTSNTKKLEELPRLPPLRHRHTRY